MQGESPLVQLKNPTVVNMTTCRLSSCKTGEYNVHLLIILKRQYSSVYRKKKRNVGMSYIHNMTRTVGHI